MKWLGEKIGHHTSREVFDGDTPLANAVCDEVVTDIDMHRTFDSKLSTVSLQKDRIAFSLGHNAPKNEIVLQPRKFCVQRTLLIKSSSAISSASVELFQFNFCPWDPEYSDPLTRLRAAHE